MSVRTTDDDDLVDVVGEMDARATAAVRDAVISPWTSCARPRASADGGRPRVAVLDLSGVTFASSAGLAVLLELQARAAAGDVPLGLVVPQGTALARLLTQTGLHGQFTVGDTVDDARRAGRDRMDAVGGEDGSARA